MRLRALHRFAAVLLAVAASTMAAGSADADGGAPTGEGAGPGRHAILQPPTPEEVRPPPYPDVAGERTFTLPYQQRRVVLPILYTLAAGLFAAALLGSLWRRPRWRIVLAALVLSVAAGAFFLFRDQTTPIGLIGLLALGAAMVTSLEGERWQELLWLAAIVLAGTALRVAFAEPTLMGMSNYSREPVFAPWMLDLELPIYALFPDGMDRKELAASSNLVLSCALPLLIYLLGRTLLARPRASLFAAATFALLPLAIYSARSDTQLIGSMALATGCLFLQQRAIAAGRWYEELLYGTGTVTLFVALLASRELDFLIAAVALVPSLALVWRRPPGFWHKAAWGVLLVATFLVTRHASNEGVGRMLEIARQGLPDLAESLLAHNNFFQPSFFPLAFTLLALFASVVLWKKEKTTLFLLLAWFGGFYLAHGVVYAKNTTALVRYALHSLVPICFAVGAGADALFARLAAWRPQRRWVRPAALALSAAAIGLSIVPARAMFDEPPSDLQEEYAFLRELGRSGLPEPGSMVVESYGQPLGDALPPRRRFEYVGKRVRGNELMTEVASSDRLLPFRGPVYFYEGLPCIWLREGTARRSDACERTLASGRWSRVKSRTIGGWSHDFSHGKEAAGFEIALYRLEKAPAEAPAAAAGPPPRKR